MTIYLEMEQFISRFDELNPKEPVFVNIGGRDPLALKAQPSRSAEAKALVVLFHGALGRSKGAEVPSFLNVRPSIIDSAHQISIADPGVQKDNRVGVGWFAGSEANPAQKLLPAFFARLEVALGVDRVIFVGSSGGGFGALYYSWQLPGSIACVSVPQTSAWEYDESTLRIYLKECWPQGLDAYQEPPMLNLCDIYSQNLPNTIVYVQSSLDGRHLQRHMIPFLNAIKLEDRCKVALKVSYWGRKGHSGSVPPGERDGWLKAAITAPDASAESIVHQYQLSGVETTPLSEVMMRDMGVSNTRVTEPDGKPGTKEMNYQDLVWSKMIAGAQINEGR